MRIRILLALSLGLIAVSLPLAQAEGGRTETKTTTTQTHVLPGGATVTETTTRTRIEERSSSGVVVEVEGEKTIGNKSVPHGSIEVQKVDDRMYPVPVTFIPREIWYQDTPEAAYMGVYSANRLGDPAWIVAGFAPDEAAEVSRMVYDEAMLARNTALAQGIVKETIIGREEYKEHAILRVKLDLANGETRVVRMPFRQVNGRWYLTNDLQADAAFVPVED